MHAFRLIRILMLLPFWLAVPQLLEAQGASEAQRLLLLPLAPQGFAGEMDALEMTERLRAAMDRTPGLNIATKAGTDSALGSRGADIEGCFDWEWTSCLDMMAKLADSRYVVRGTIGRSGSRNYLLVQWRDCEKRLDASLRIRTWQTRGDAETAFESVAYEVSQLVSRGQNKAAGGLGAMPPKMPVKKALERKDEVLAMTLALLPGGGFMYLEQYGLAAAYFTTEVGFGIGALSSFGHSDNRYVIFGGIGLVLVKFADILHSGYAARRLNRNMGFITWKVYPIRGRDKNPADIGGIRMEYAYKF